jgi:hypothetical protein
MMAGSVALIAFGLASATDHEQQLPGLIHDVLDSPRQSC